MSSRILHRLYKPISSGKTEDPDEYKWDGLHPVHIGDVFKDGRYRVVHKLRHGSFSTVWLTRDEQTNRYVALKIIEAENSLPDSKELQVLRELSQRKLDHPGRDYVMTLLDDFWLTSPNGRHLCLVTEVAGSRVARPEHVSYPDLTIPRTYAHQLVQGVAYLRACNMAHGDLYTSNILSQLAKFDSWSDEDVYNCVGKPNTELVHRLDSGPLDSTIPQYLMQPLNMQELEKRLAIPKILIIDFGQAFYCNGPPNTLTPKIFSAPEILFGTEVTEATDHWQMGCTIFELCSGFSLFSSLFNPKMDVLKDIISMLGKPPDTMWQRWQERDKYFEDDGTPKQASGRLIPVKPYRLVDRVRDIVKQDKGAAEKANARLVAASDFLEPSEERPPNDILVLLHDFLGRLLIYESDKRLPIEEALIHPFFS